MTKTDQIRSLTTQQLTDLLNEHGTIHALVLYLNDGIESGGIRKVISQRIQNEHIEWKRIKKRSFSYTKIQVQQAFKEANCWSDVFRSLNLTICGFNKIAIMRFAEHENIEVPIFTKKQLKETFRRNKYVWSKETIFCENSRYGRQQLRGAVLKYNIISKYQCSECGIENMWNKKPILLELDHINGISNDNRKDNLRWLCPNCHSQTETYKGKNKKK